MILFMVGFATQDGKSAVKLLEEHESVDRIEHADGCLVVTLAQGIEDYSELPSILIGAGHKLTLLREEEVNLESAFMALTKGMGAKT